MDTPVQQELLDHECPEDALTADVAAAGGPYVLGKKLRPELDKTDARNWLLNCLNHNHKQNMTQAQVRLLVNIAREKGACNYIQFLARDNAMSKPVPIEPEDRKAKLQRDFISAVKQLDQIKAEIIGG